MGDYGATVHDVNGPAGEVYALYEGLLGRAPDAAGGQSWVAALNAGTSLHDVTAAILSSPEAQAHLNASDNASFVEQLYETVLGRHADAGGLQTWTDALAQGTSRADVAMGIAESPEAQQHLAAQVGAGLHVV